MNKESNLQTSFHREEVQSGNYHTCTTIHKRSGSALFIVVRQQNGENINIFIRHFFSFIFHTHPCKKYQAQELHLQSYRSQERAKISPMIFGFLLFNLGISAHLLQTTSITWMMQSVVIHQLEVRKCAAAEQWQGAMHTRDKIGSFITGHCVGLVPELSIVHFPSYEMGHFQLTES